MRKPTLEERFWARVEVGPVDECWPWTGANDGEYGQIHDPEWIAARAVLAGEDTE